MSSNSCDKVIDEYYQKIYNYCYAQLNFDHYAAGDCTQEVFLIMIRKKTGLEFSEKIKLWLYRTADNVIRQYRRKKKRIEAEDIAEHQIAVDNNFEIKGEESVFDKLSDEEYKLLEDYYGGKYENREEIAEKYGITIEKLYKRIHFIKKKLE